MATSRAGRSGWSNARPGAERVMKQLSTALRPTTKTSPRGWRPFSFRHSLAWRSEGCGGGGAAKAAGHAAVPGGKSPLVSVPQGSAMVASVRSPATWRTMPAARRNASRQAWTSWTTSWGLAWMRRKVRCRNRCCRRAAQAEMLQPGWKLRSRTTACATPPPFRFSDGISFRSLAAPTRSRSGSIWTCQSIRRSHWMATSISPLSTLKKRKKYWPKAPFTKLPPE
mmetsp:Transcript_26796/g.77991  ORF Transcript_26796/g.77991 Transcript_26796/m.77991 type:complete len:225 (-) Transcript_26796:2031-2705(-)